MGNGPYDVFGPHWGLGLPISWFDETAIEALLTAALTGSSQIDQLVEGWEGEEGVTFEIIRTLLRAKGYFPAYTATGLVSFARVRLANVLDIGNVSTVAPLPDTLRRQPAIGDGVDRVVATYGKTPWFDGQTITVNALSSDPSVEPTNSLRAGIFADEAVVSLDMRAIAPPSLEQEGFDLVAYVAARGLALDTLHIRANDPGTIGLGDIVRIGDPLLQETWFTDESGEPIEVDASPRWYGQVRGFRRDLMNASIDLTVRMNPNEFARLRAPSAIVASVAGAVYTCDSNVFEGPDGDPFGTGLDVEQFQVDDFVEVWTEDGVRRSGTAVSPDVAQITAVTPATPSITVDVAFTTPPVAGDILRLAHLSTANGSPEADSALVPGFVAHVFSADADGLLGPNDTAGHIYGFGVL